MIRNLTTGKVLSRNANFTKNSADKAFGMLLAKNSSGIILHTRFGIHTLFMKHPIDVLVLDSSKKIVKIRKRLLPFRFMIWNPMFNTVIELEQGTVEKTQTKVGDKLDF